MDPSVSKVDVIQLIKSDDPGALLDLEHSRITDDGEAYLERIKREASEFWEDLHL